LILLTVSINQAFSQIEEVELNPEGIVFPRYDTVERDNLSAVIGQCIYNTDYSFVECFDGSNWVVSSRRFVGFLGYSGPSFSIQNGQLLYMQDWFESKDPTDSFGGRDFTAPEAGYYYFETQISFTKELVDIPELTGYIRIGNTSGLEYRLTIDDNDESIQASRMMYLNKGDKVGVQVYAESSNGESCWLASRSPFNGILGDRMFFTGYKSIRKILI